MIDINELRKVIADCYWPTSPVAINEILDRLEAAEKGRDWHAERCEDAMNKCDALRAKITEMEISKHEISEAHNAVTRRLSVLADENITLRAKIERMERQEPVAWTTKLALRHGANALGFDACAGNLWGEKGVPLYTLPGAHPKPDCGEAGHDEGCCGNRQCLSGAQPAQSVPDGWKLVPIGPTQEMINHVIDERLDALAAGKDHTFIDIYKAMLAAAPEAKP